MAYPTTLDNIPTGTVGQLESVAAGIGHTNWHNQKTNAVNALETKIGIDNSGVNNTLDYRVKQGWNVDTNSPTFVSATSFTVTGNETSIYTLGRRVRLNSATTPVYLDVISSSFGGGLTTVVTSTGVTNPINSLDYALTPSGSTQVGSNQIVSNSVTYRNWTSYVVGNNTISTTSTSYVALTTAFKVVTTTHGGDVFVDVDVSTVYGVGGNITLFIDGSDVNTLAALGQGFIQILSSSIGITARFVYQTNSLSVGSHTFQPFWKSSGGTINWDTDFYSSISVVEYLK